MKTLVLVRHAKSSWSAEGVADIDRGLNKRGKRDAPAMATRFAAHDLEIEQVVCSPAKRARRTAKIFCGELGYQWHKVIIDDRLYLAEPSDILDVLKQLDDDIDSVMMFGHNPGFTELANQFVAKPIANVPTTGIVTLVFDTSRWKRVARLSPVDSFFDYPKKHR